ncbi:MAG: translation initiation factor IF-2, partial [Myxococcota bacterium]
VRSASVGGINESDVNLATTMSALIVGFNVRADNKAQALAERSGIDIRLYSVIYELLDEIKERMEKKLAPTIQEKALGTIEIRQVFHISKVGKIAGCYVSDGKVTRHSLLRLYRDDKKVHEGKVASLRRGKNEAKEVNQGFECGIQIEGYQDIKEGDIIEAYRLEEHRTKLEFEE